MTKGPLAGIQIIDWTIWQFGPVATMMLADLGADVIKIEAPDGDPGRALRSSARMDVSLAGDRNSYFEGNNRNKRSITLDLRKPEAREIMYGLTKNADVFVENFRRGVAERLGMGYETLREYNSKLIYASASGLGPKGPDAHRPAFDTVGQARGGLMHAAAAPGSDPYYVQGGVADQVGAVLLSWGVLAALVARSIHGVGQKIDVSHLGSVMWLQGMALGMGLLNKQWRPPFDRLDAPNPLSNGYKCKDGKWLQFICLQADRYWADFCKLLGLEHLIEDPRFANMTIRADHAKEFIAMVDPIFASKTAEEWEKAISDMGADLIFSRVQHLMELENDPQVVSNKYIVEVPHPVLGPVKLVNHPIEYSETPSALGVPAPELGQHTEEILIEKLGYTWDQILELQEKGVI